jgi:hypothetical protein
VDVAEYKDRCECGNELLGSIKRGEFLGYLTNC